MLDVQTLLTGAVGGGLVSGVMSWILARRNERLQRELKQAETNAAKTLEDHRAANQDKLARRQKKLAEDLKNQDSRHAKDLEELRSDMTRLQTVQKAELDKQGFVHQVQFEKEFGIYLEFWKRLVALRRATKVLALPAASQEDIQNKRLLRFDRAYRSAYSYRDDHQPFFDLRVAEASCELFNASWAQSISAIDDTVDRATKRLEIREHQKAVELGIATIASVIRERIGLMTR